MPRPRAGRREAHPWVRVAACGALWEADLLVARLAADGVPARAMGNDLAGIFGAGFVGATARGAWVEVPAPCQAQARVLLARPAPLPPDGEAP